MPSENVIKPLDEKFVDLIGKFVSNVQNGKLSGSCNIALSMLSLLEQIINESENATPFELCSAVKSAGRRVSEALPRHVSAPNVARRVLRAIRDETRTQTNQGSEAPGESLARLVLGAGARRATIGAASADLREPLRDHLAELRLELESSASAIASQAREHVHADELILTHGGCALTEQFLKAAAPRGYRLILAESADVAQSHAMARRLSLAGVQVTVVSHAAVYAVMSRVNKVVLSTAAALAGGAELCAGARDVTRAARAHSVPVLALAPLHALCARAAPLPAPHAPPHTALPYTRHETSVVHVASPAYDFAPPEHITLFITNLGGSSPSYMYRLLSELYDPSDYDL